MTTGTRNHVSEEHQEKGIKPMSLNPASNVAFK